MVLALLVAGDEVVRGPPVPAELVLLDGRDVDVLEVPVGLLGHRHRLRLVPRLIGQRRWVWRQPTLWPGQGSRQGRQDGQGQRAIGLLPDRTQGQ